MNRATVEAPRVGPGHPSSALSIYFLIFSPFYFSLSSIGFTYFLLLSIPSLSTRIVPLRFQAGGRRRRTNLGLVCVLFCTLCYLYSLVKMDCGVLFCFVCVCVPSVLWHCWLGHLTRKIPSPIWPIMCRLDVKPYSINQSTVKAIYATVKPPDLTILEYAWFQL